MSVGAGILGTVDAGFTTFDTAIGGCAIAWRGERVTGFQLPETSVAATRKRIARGGLQAADPPEPIARAVTAVVAHVAGTLDDLRWIAVDVDRLPEFDRGVYRITRAIDPGDTMTYGEVAAELGARGAAQAVGQALGRNPIPMIIPCHRVLAAGQRLGGFSAYGGIVTKRELLAIEGADGFSDPTLF